MQHPVIERIEDVLPHVEGRRDFVVARKDGYTVIDYVFAGPDTFDHPMRIECRGLKFGADGKIMARPLHKFFNIGEKPGTLPENIDLARHHIIMDKLDGSMVHTAVLNGQLVLMTRMGRTDVALKAEKLVTPEQSLRLAECATKGRTAIFEFIAPDNRIIIKYEAPELVLLAVRDTISGEYFAGDVVETMAEQLGVRAVGVVPSRWKSANDLLAWSRACVGVEGYIVRFDDGLWVKAKGDDYVVKHKAKDNLTHEKNVLALILASGVDDVLPLLDEPDRKALIAYAARVQDGLRSVVDHVVHLVETGKMLDQKCFATMHLAKQDAGMRSMCFKVRSAGVDKVVDVVKDYIGRHIGSQSDVDGIRHLIGAPHWSL